MLYHIGQVREKKIVRFVNDESGRDFMKVCDKNGCGGVVDLTRGAYIPCRDLEDEGLSKYCRIIE